MKKALLTLTMVCTLPISSLNAGWRDWLPTLPAWQAQPEPSGAPAFKENDGYSDDYKQAAQPIMNIKGQIKTQEKRQTYLDTAKKDGYYTVGAIVSILPLVVVGVSIAMVGKINKGKPLIEKTASVLFALIAYGISMSERLSVYYATKSLYNLLQAQRYEKQDIEQLKKTYVAQITNLTNMEKNDAEQAHMSPLIV